MKKVAKIFLITVLILMLTFGILIWWICLEMNSYAKKEKSLSKIKYEFFNEDELSKELDGKAYYIKANEIIDSSESSSDSSVVSEYEQNNEIKKIDLLAFYRDVQFDDTFYQEIKLHIETNLIKRSSLLVAIQKQLFNEREETYKGPGNYYSENVKIANKKCKVESVREGRFSGIYKTMIKYYTKEYSIEIEFIAEESAELDYQQALNTSIKCAEQILEALVKRSA